jgi:predicted permease
VTPSSPGARPSPQFYIPADQIPAEAWDWVSRTLGLVVRSDQDAAALTSVLREAVRAVDPTVPVYDVRTMAERRQRTMAQESFGAALLSALGLVGLVLSGVGIYGVVAWFVSQRTREIAVRLALGASRGRLVRQLVVESLALSLLGGVLGVFVAAWTGDLLLRFLPGDGTSRVIAVEPEPRMALFALALSVLTGVVFGLVPALQATRPSLASTLKNESSSLHGGSAPFRFRKGLVVAQVALSLLLLIGAGLFTRSLSNLRALDPGFESERLLAFSLDPSLNGYAIEKRWALFDDLQQKIAAEPGVRSVSLAEIALLTNSNSSSTVRVEGYEAKDGEDMNPNFNRVAPGFFATLGIPLVSGRDFTEADRKGAPQVAVVNEAFAKYFFKDQDPVGRRFGLRRNKDGGHPIEIVGLVKDGKVASLREETKRFVYVPYTQDESIGSMTFYVRSAGGDASSLGPRLRQLAAAADRTLPVTDLKTMETQIGESLVVERMVATLSAAFGLLATALAALGLYGVMSYAVSLRTREIGVRVALGARHGQVLWLVLAKGLKLAVLGAAAGALGTLALIPVLRSIGSELPASDPAAVAVLALVLIAVALFACWLPARRAAKVDPMEALRYE